MKIQLSQTFKSLQPFTSEELNDLTIITGKNGSGKSQLLNLISIKSTGAIPSLATAFDFVPTIKKIQVEGIQKESSVELNASIWKQVISQQQSQLKQLNVLARKLISYCVTNGFNIFDRDREKRNLISKSSEYQELLVSIYREIPVNQGIKQVQVSFDVESEVINYVFIGKEALIKTLKEISRLTGKKIEDIVENDFLSVGLAENFVDSDDLFRSQIEVIFYNYAKRFEKNSRDYFRKEKFRDQNNAIPDTEFAETYPAPWKIINEILSKHKIEFEFGGIDPVQFEPEASYSLDLIKKSINRVIPLNDLSSGEKIIIGLIIKLFTSEYYSRSLSFPELIILDEPDAHLHPEMSKLLIDVLNETFVKSFGIKIIFTTHSPSTIALAPEDSIYELKNDHPTSLKCVTKDYALKLLTSFVPFLSIDYKNHRQVFVESPTDIMYYQMLYDKHSQFIKLGHQLYFISNAMGQGNSTSVYNIVRDLRSAGNSSSYGIVDWDSENNPTDYVYVHGENERYSIENFVLDPIYLAILLVKIKGDDIPAEIGINPITDNELDIGKKSSEELQKISDVIFKRVQARFPTKKAKVDMAEIRYHSGRVIKVPKWFLFDQGHGLEEKFKETFPSLKNKFRNEKELHTELMSILIKSYPFVPESSIRFIEKIAITE